MKPCFETQLEQISRKLRQIREPGDLCFALLTDTRLSDRAADTAENIRQVDRENPFDCVIHLGDVLVGNTPRDASGRILSQEMDLFRNSLGTRTLFVTPGENDGFRDERFMGQMIHGIFTEDWWHRRTDFIDSHAHVSRPGKKPYYFADYPDKKLRLVFLYSYTVQIDQEMGLFEKTPVFDTAQLAWLAKQALKVPEGWTVLLFSHCLPKSRLETGKDPYVYKGNATEQLLSLLQKAQRRGVSIGCWFAGHYHCDAQGSVAGIRFSVTDSVCPQNTLARGGEFQTQPQREENTPTQDLWDAVVVKPRSRKIYLFRFGPGTDRIIEYG